MKTKLSWVELNYLSFFAQLFNKDTIFQRLILKFEDVFFRMNYKAIMHIKSFFFFEKEAEKTESSRFGPSSSYGKPDESRRVTASNGFLQYLDMEATTTLSEGSFPYKKRMTIATEYTTREKMVGYKRNTLKLHYVINPPSDHDLMVNDQKEEKISPKALKERVESTVTCFLSFLHEVVFTIMKPALTKNYDANLSATAEENKQKTTELYTRILLMRIIFKRPVIWGIVRYAFEFFGLREESLLLKNYLTRQNCTPKDLEIKPDFQLVPPPGAINPSEPYADAISLVKDIETTHCLLQKYHMICIVKEQIANCISEFYAQIQESKPQKKRILDSDQLLSIYTFVLLSARNCKLFTDIQLINSFLSRALTGSGSDGYYYTTFSATVCYFLNAKPDEKEVNFRDILLRELEKKFLDTPSSSATRTKRLPRFSIENKPPGLVLAEERKQMSQSLLEVSTENKETVEFKGGQSNEVNEGLIGTRRELTRNLEKYRQDKRERSPLRGKGNPSFRFFPGENHYSILHNKNIGINPDFYSA